MVKRKTKHRTLSQALLSGDVSFAGHVEVVGGYYHAMWEAKVDGLLEEGKWLMMKREPHNKHDGNAISVWVRPSHMVPQRIGYVAKEKAEFLAPFMDIGVKMALRVLTHSQVNQPIRLTARLYIKK